MAFTFTLQELASDLGTNTADGLRNIANTAANFACDLYQNYSNAAVGLPDPTGVGAFNNALYSRLCGPRNKNPANPPVPPFTGGQCPIKYNVTVVYKLKDFAPITAFIPQVLGPIRGVNRGPSTSSNRTAQRLVFSPDATYPTGTADLVNNTDPNQIIPFEVISITPVPVSGPDNCGNPAPSYPIKYPPNSSVTNNNISVNVGAGMIINAPISIIPVKVDANVEFKPQIQVDVGPFNVVFDLGGVSVNPTFNIGQQVINPNPQYQPPATKPSVNFNIDNQPCNTTELEADLSTVLAKLTNLEIKTEEIKDCSCPVSYTQGTVTLGGGEGGVVALPTNCVQVRLQLTTIPLNAKFQEGRGDSPDQYFCGYYSFGDGVGQGARVAINTAQSVFEVPVWATSFSWNLYVGYDCIVTGVRLVPSKQDSELISRQMYLKPS